MNFVALYAVVFLKTVIAFLFTQYGFLGCLVQQEISVEHADLSAFSSLVMLIDMLFVFAFCYIGDRIGRKSVTTLVITITLFFLLSLLFAQHQKSYLITHFIVSNKLISFGYLAIVVSIKLQILEMTSNRRSQYLAIELQNFTVSLANLLSSLLYVFYFRKNGEVFTLVIIVLFFILVLFLFIRIKDSCEFEMVKNTKTQIFGDKKNLLYSIFIQMFVYAHFYLVFIYFGSLLKDFCGYSADDLITHSVYLLLFTLARSLFSASISYKINPMCIAKNSLYAYAIVIFLIPIVMDLDFFTYYNKILILQVFLVLFNPYHLIEAIIISNFSIAKRFTSYVASIYISKALAYTLTTFALAYFLTTFGYYGICIFFTPLLILFLKSIGYYKNVL